MEVFAVVRNIINSNEYDTEFFYVEDYIEALGYAKKGIEILDKEIRFLDRPHTILWEVFEMPCDFEKPLVKDFTSNSVLSYSSSPIPKMVQHIREKSVKKIN